jgi:carboxyl-terminal processing protease
VNVNIRRPSRIAAFSILLVLGSSLMGGWLGGRAVAGATRLSDYLHTYTTIFAVIEQEYVDEVKPDRLVAASIREMLRTLDPHSNFLETKEYSSLQERQKGSYYGLGITVQAVDGNITVVSPFEGTPAYRLGIRAGDIISRIEDEDARGMSIDDAVKRLRGPKGSAVRITIVRQGFDGPLEFTVIRDEIPLHSVQYYFMLDKKTGYLRHTDFNETTACRPGDPKGCEKELEKALKALKAQGATAIIMDIRDNPGGLLEQAFAVSNLFLKKGQLVVFTRGRTKRDESNYITEGDSPFSEIPLVLLTSKHSASASEIVAGAIQDHDRGLIVGERTFGKGLVQTIMPLHNVRGYALALTTARYYTPSGRLIQRDYASTPLEDYHSPKDRKSCEEGQGEAKLTDAGRKVYGGDGITPDYCVDPETPSKFVSYLITRAAFMNFSRGYGSAAGMGAAQEIAGTGKRSGIMSAKVHVVEPDFQVDDRMYGEFRTFLNQQKLRFTEEELTSQREEISRHIVEEILRQAFGEAEAKKRTSQWDPQVKKALEVVSKAGVLLKDPHKFIADRQAEGRVASASGGAAAAAVHQ